MLEIIGIIGLVIGLYIAVVLTILVIKLKDGIEQIQSLKQIISDKLKTKYEIVNEMTVLEAKKTYVRAKSIILEMLTDTENFWINVIGKAMGGKGGSSGYREGR
jgi:hypothetical protein